ncbi:hypothetical protein [Cellulomonas alba]|uniref:Uncharacterized protein n=1 Tax=Cellulomonas alba TaxID=3053467 RepID=A0ABT7SFH4_9CELL|nr:hypothetical protein [Cellulomonas alba]MDM7854925.1 hypothetical protein [Cellulomonas alba]
MPTYRAVTDKGLVLGAPFTARTDEAAFATLDTHLEAEPVWPSRFVGVEVLVGGTWLDAGLWRELPSRVERAAEL